MALSTTNKYGNITISDEVIAMITSNFALECYGVVELASCRLSDSILMLFKRIPIYKGIKLVTMDNRIFIDIYVVIKDSVNVAAVTDSLKSTIEYNLENITGMRVKSVAVHIVGVQV